MTFLFIAPTPFYENRGCHLRIRFEAEALKKKGHKVIIVTYKQGSNIKNLDVRRPIFSVGNFDKGVSSGSWKNIPNGIFLFGRALRICMEVRPNVLHCHLHEGAAIGFCIKIISRVLSLFTYNPILVFDGQGGMVEEMKESGMLKNKFLLNLFIFLEKIIMKFPNLIFVSSQNFYQKTNKKNLGTKIVFLPDTISLLNINKDQIKKYLRTKEEKIKILKSIKEYFSKESFIKIQQWIEEEKTLIVYSGGFGQSKGFISFLKNIVPLFIKDKKVCFLFGGGDESKLSISPNFGNIVFVKELNAQNLRPFLLLGDIGVDPKPIKTFESSGKILNYMATGLPVVCFDQPNNRYFLQENGFYAKSEKDFKKLIEDLSLSVEKRRKYGIKNLDRVFNKFTQEVVGETIEKEIKDLK